MSPALRSRLAYEPAADRVPAMRILLTNDDGIDSPGLHALRQIASELSHDVWVVAPETNQSGASHSLSLHEPLRMRQIDERAFAVRGTPTDSVIMGVRHLLKGQRPRLGAVGRQPRRQHGRRRDLFGHHRGSVRGNDPRNSLHGAVAGLWHRIRQRPEVGDGDRARTRTDPQAVGDGVGAFHGDEHQFPRPRSRRGGRHRR